MNWNYRTILKTGDLRADGYRNLESEGWLTVSADGVDLTPAGLLQIDRHLTRFFDPEHLSNRYT